MIYWSVLLDTNVTCHSQRYLGYTLQASNHSLDSRNHVLVAFYLNSWDVSKHYHNRIHDSQLEDMYFTATCYITFILHYIFQYSNLNIFN